MQVAYDGTFRTLMLISRGIDVHHADSRQLTALHYAVMHCPSLVDVLLSHGANINAQDNMGKSPIYTDCAARSILV